MDSAASTDADAADVAAVEALMRKGFTIRSGHDTTGKYVEQLRLSTPDEVPPIEALGPLLRRPLPELLVTFGDCGDFQRLGCEQLPVRPVLKLGEGYPRALGHHLYNALCMSDLEEGSGRSAGAIATEIASTFGRLLRLLFKGSGPSISVTACAPIVEGISEARVHMYRLDLTCCVGQALVFKGEHRVKPGKLEKATKNLLDKLTSANTLQLSGLPYLPCYAASGTELQFFAFHQQTKDGRPRLQPISEPLSMSTASGRVAAIVAIVNIYTLLCKLKNCVRVSLGPPLGVLLQKRHRTLYLEPHQMLKICHPTASTSHARGLYTLLTAGLPHCIRVLEETWEKGAVRLVMAPVGLQTLPKTAGELKAAIKCVLTALQALHAAGYVHRDVRPPNIVYAGGDDWLLIDFEAADTADSEVPQGAIAPQHLPPEVELDNDDKPYGTAGDIYCLGKVLKEWANGARYISNNDGSGCILRDGDWLGEEGRALRDGMLNPDPAARPTATAALASPWFATPSAPATTP